MGRREWIWGDAECGARNGAAVLVLLEDRDLGAGAEIDRDRLQQVVEVRRQRVRRAALGEDAAEGTALAAEKVGEVECELAELAIDEGAVAVQAVGDVGVVDRSIGEARQRDGIGRPAARAGVAGPDPVGEGDDPVAARLLEVELDQQVAIAALVRHAVRAENARLVELEAQRAGAVRVVADEADVREQIAADGLAGDVDAVVVDLVVRDRPNVDAGDRIAVIRRLERVVVAAGRQVVLADDAEGRRTPVGLAAANGQVAVGRVEGGSRQRHHRGGGDR